MNTKILVCCHKEDIHASSNIFFPIHVGKSLYPDISLGIAVDNDGENISLKNASYCELTGMYWAWKNLKGLDIIGLNHYRRYFDFKGIGKKGFPHTAVSTSLFSEKNIGVPTNVLEKVMKGSIVVPKPEIYNMTLVQNYCYWHVADDFKILEYVFYKTQSRKMQEIFFRIMRQGIELVHYNMFLMKWDDFDAYCSWLFPILEEVERMTYIKNYNVFQKRIYGYMAERLFMVWLAIKTNVIYKPVVFFTDDMFEHKNENLIKYKFRNICYKIANKLTCPKHFHYYENVEDILPYYLKSKIK